MSPARRSLAWTGILALALATACGEDVPSTGTADLPIGRSELPTPDQVVENGEHILTYQGVKKAVVEAEQLYFYNQAAKVIGDTIQVTFFDDSGKYVSMLTARTGEMVQGTQEMTARGDVFVRSPDATIRTEELHYDPARNLIRSDEPTEINQGGNVIRGRRGVESDPGLKEIKIRGGSAVLRSEPRLGSPPGSRDTARTEEGEEANPAVETAEEASPAESPAGEEAREETGEDGPEQEEGGAETGGGDAGR